MDGSGRETLRNRQFLRKYIPYIQPVQTRTIQPYMYVPISSDTNLPDADSNTSAIPNTPSTPSVIPHADTSKTSEAEASVLVSPKMPVLSPERPVYHPRPQSLNSQARVFSPQGPVGNPQATPQTPPRAVTVRRSSRITKPVDRLGVSLPGRGGGGDNA